MEIADASSKGFVVIGLEFLKGMPFGKWSSFGVNPCKKLGRGAVECEANFGEVNGIEVGKIMMEQVGGSGKTDAKFMKKEVVALYAFAVEEVMKIERKHI